MSVLTMPMIVTEAPTETIDVRTTRYGEMETVRVSTEVMLTFPDGMPGFERHHRYALLQDERLAPFFWLQSLHDPLVGFLVVSPGYLVNDYMFDIADPDVEMLDLDGPTEARVLTILVVPEDVREMTANMQAPIIVNPVKRIAKQVILTDERFPLRYPVFGNLRIEPRTPERRRSC
jgi:flagellar assembly factor FliW